MRLIQSTMPKGSWSRQGCYVGFHPSEIASAARGSRASIIPIGTTGRASLANADGLRISENIHALKSWASSHVSNAALSSSGFSCATPCPEWIVVSVSCLQCDRIGSAIVPVSVVQIGS